MSTKPNIDMPPEILLDFLNKHIKLCSMEGQTYVLIGKTLAHDIAMALRDMVQIDSVLTRRTALDSIPRRFDKIVKCLNTAAMADPNDKQAEYIKALEDIAEAAKNGASKLHSISIGDGFDDELEKDDEYLALKTSLAVLEKFQGKLG